MMTTPLSVAGLLLWLLAVAAVAAFGSQFMPGDWYAALVKPAWTPPGRVFGPVWTVLYAMMAVAAWLVWRDRGFAGAPLALGLFAIQLLLNAAWSWLFFGLQRPGLAAIEIVLLGFAIAATSAAFWRYSRPAAVLMLPYLGWVMFAAALNVAIWLMNA